jgi:hypothetical protein
MALRGFSRPASLMGGAGFLVRYDLIHFTNSTEWGIVVFELVKTISE